MHVLASGSDGNCTVIASEDTTIMIDAGISGRRIAKLMEGVGLDPRELDAILLTHEHSDQVSGAGHPVPEVQGPGVLQREHAGLLEHRGGARLDHYSRR